MQLCFGSASDAMLGAICRTSADAPRCAELLKLDLSVQAFWQAKTTFSLPKSTITPCAIRGGRLAEFR
eukprot:3695543-Prymnesium_polylepis.1